MGGVRGDIGSLLDREALQTGELVWLLTFNLQGADYLFASEAVTVTDASNVSYQYDPSLVPPSLSTTFALFSNATDLPSASVEFLFPGSIAQKVANGASWAAATAALSLWIKGTNSDDRYVLIKGAFTSASYGDVGEPVNGTIKSRTLDDEALFPDPSAVINAETWPTASTSVMGKSYPFICGTPGRLPAQVSTGAAGGIVSNESLAGTPAYKVSNTQLLVAGHAVTADWVSLWNASAELIVITNQQPTLATDGLGRVVTVIETVSGWDDADWQISWFNRNATTEGGIESQRPDRNGKPLNDLGELMSYLFKASTVTSDIGRITAVSDRVRFMKTSGSITERVSPYRWILDNIAPLLPMSMAVSGSEGVYPILWDMDATRSDAVESLVEMSVSGGNCSRISAVMYEDIELANEIVVRYAWDTINDDYAASTTLDGNPEQPIKQATFPGWRVMNPNSAKSGLAGYTNAAATGWPNAYARLSYLRHGTRAITVEAPFIYDTATASFVAQWMSRAKCTPPRVVQYAIDRKLAWLTAGDVVTINDTSISVDSVAIVRTIEWSDVTPVVELLLIEDPIKDTNATP